MGSCPGPGGNGLCLKLLLVRGFLDNFFKISLLFSMSFCSFCISSSMIFISGDFSVVDVVDVSEVSSPSKSKMSSILVSFSVE